MDNICFIISGNTTAWSTLLWPHRWSLFSQTVTINGKQVSDYNVQIRDHLIGSGAGVLCHEMFHTLGAPDLYHYSQDGLSPAGIWDVMESNQNPPQSMGAYMKYRYGNWISSVPLISAPGVYTLNPVTHASNNCYRINSPNSLSEYFVVEYRKDSGIFESSLPGSGLIVYRINNDFDGQGNAGYDGVNILDEVYIYRPYGSISQNGTVSDANFSASVYRRKINDNTNPSSFLSDGQPGGLRISNVTASAGTISFELNGGPVLPVNAAIENIVSPLTGCNVPVQTVKAEIRNYGSSALAPGFSVSYRIQSQAVVTETYTGPAIASGGQTLFTFGQPATLPPGETAFVKIWVSVAGDSYPANDTASCILVNAWLNYPAELAQNLIQTYTSLGSNGNAISTSGFDDANSAPVNIGFNFYYNCRWFNQFILNTNGFIKLGSAPPSSPSLFFTSAQSGNGGIFNSNDTADNNIIAAFNHDLGAGTLTPEYRVYTSGTTGNRICTIQFSNLRDKSNPPDSQYDNLEFQIKLYEQDYRIEFVYGTWQASAASSAFKTSAVGLKGSHNSYGHLLVCRKGSAQSWDNIIFENSNYSGTSTLNFGRPPDRPAPGSGRTLRFVPGQQPNVVSLPASAVNSASAIANGTVSAGDYAGQVFFEYGLTASYGNTSIASPAQLSQGATSAVTASITGLSPATQYHFRAVFINPQGTFYGSGLTFTTLTTGISSHENINPVIFPNPASGKINIQLHGGNAAPEFMITDLNGRLLLNKKLSVSADFLYTLNTEILSPGVYMLRIIAGESVSCCKFFISGE